MNGNGLLLEKAKIKARLEIALCALKSEQDKDFLNSFESIKVDRKETIKKATNNLREAAQLDGVDIAQIAPNDTVMLVKTVNDFIDKLHD